MRSAGHAYGCPKCGSDILKSAPLPIVGLVVKPFVEKRRYRCRQCGWTGWKHRLHRHNSALPSAYGRSSADRRAVWFFIFVVLFILATAIVLIRMVEREPTLRAGTTADVARAVAPAVPIDERAWRSS